MEIYRRLYATLSPRRQREFFLTLVMMLVTGAMEMCTVGLIFPVLAVLVRKPRAAVARSPLFDVAHMLVGGITQLQLVALFIAAVAGAALLRLVLTWQVQRFVAAVGHELGLRVWDSILHQSYEDYVDRNSSTVLGGLEKVRPAQHGVIQPAMQGLAAATIALALIVLIALIYPVAAGVIAALTIVIYGTSSLITRRRLRANSAAVADGYNVRTQLVQEGLGGFRDIVLRGSQTVFLDRFRAIDKDQHDAAVSTAIIAATPRFLAEAAAISGVIIVTLIASRQPGGIALAIPALGALALGGQRLLPLLQQAYGAWTQVSSNRRVILDVLALIHNHGRDVGSTAPTQRVVWDTITFEGVSFAYRKSRNVLADVSVTLHRGEWIGIVGRSGAGKSTFLDLLMGLIEPGAGQVLADRAPLRGGVRQGWREQLAHVPQHIFLLDNSLSANIAFGIPPDEVDAALVGDCAELVGLTPLLATLPDGLATMVGERGIKLSGGQRQRIGIARALYQQADLLVLDEATSALDQKAERALFQNLRAAHPEITLIVVAHRASSLAQCQRILRVEGHALVAEPNAIAAA